MTKSRRQEKRATDVADSITADLQNVRNEERLGGVVAQKSNEDLFFIDTLGKHASAVAAGGKRPKTMLTIDRILRPESAYTIGRTLQAKSRTEEVLLERKVQARAARSTASAVSGKKTGKRQLYDAWGDEDETHEVSRSTELRVPAIPVPVGGTSYNPQPAEHVAYLESLEAAELVRLETIEQIRSRQPLVGVTDGPDCVADANRKMLLDEHSEDEETLVDGAPSGTGHVTQKKTRAQRNRQKRHRQLIATQATLRSQRLLDKSIDQVPQLLQEVQDEQEAGERMDEMRRALEPAIRQQQRMSRIKQRLALEPLAVKLPEELPSSMRLLATEGNLVSDRFRSFVERGIVEPSSKLLAPEFKNRKGSNQPLNKMLEKYSYKSFT